MAPSVPAAFGAVWRPGHPAAEDRGPGRKPHDSQRNPDFSAPNLDFSEENPEQFCSASRAGAVLQDADTLPRMIVGTGICQGSSELPLGWDSAARRGAMAAGMGVPPKVFSSTPVLMQCESALGGAIMRRAWQAPNGRQGGRWSNFEDIGGRAPAEVQNKKTRHTGQEWELWSSGKNELGGATRR